MHLLIAHDETGLYINVCVKKNLVVYQERTKSNVRFNE